MQKKRKRGARLKGALYGVAIVVFVGLLISNELKVRQIKDINVRLQFVEQKECYCAPSTEDREIIINTLYQMIIENDTDMIIEEIMRRLLEEMLLFPQPKFIN